MKKTGEKIKKLRLMNRDTLKDLEKKTGVGFSTLAKIERGERKIKAEFLKQLAQIYHVNIDYFFEEEPVESLTKEEKQFVQDNQLSEKALIEKYKVIIDGEEASKEELLFAINTIRNFRKAIGKKAESGG